MCVCSGEGGSALGGSAPRVVGGCWEVGWWGWGVIPACTEADPPCGQTDTCKNITFATSLWTVITVFMHMGFFVGLSHLENTFMVIMVLKMNEGITNSEYILFHNIS